ncbi:Mitochondrial beta-keto-acyl synthase [Mycoemilia scoparia]|uniref:beta-ketoacyl-[acyl-carrier-protein] synthase I n=1 Tax=Mycoemilia scoparia TaxID=417184 RepID=A0A9W8A3C3_9FUNG|nr:Mitochondrial beta-keto-acyl synthase [Mycoemilia scoparia]
MATFTQFAMCAAKQALDDARWPDRTNENYKFRTGVCIGSGIGALDEITDNHDKYVQKGHRRVSPMFVPKILNNMAGGNITIEYGFMGPNHAVSTACATGAHAIGDAMRFIQYGDADVMVAGASEAPLQPLSLAGFCRIKALATGYNDRPTEASRPFDRDRAGFVIAEGSAIVVLEELEHAKSRGAKIYAEIGGYGLSGDASHITAPAEDGMGAQLAMRRALEVARMDPHDIDYINAHATSTPLGDEIEAKAISKVFSSPQRQTKLAVSSTKGATGHLLGGAGALEAVFAIMSVHSDILPPTLNLHNPEACSDQFNYVPLVAQKDKTINAAISNSFGFGGTNTSLVFKKYIS